MSMSSRSSISSFAELESSSVSLSSMNPEVPARDDCDLTIVEHDSQTAHPSDMGSSPCADNNKPSDVGLSRHSQFDFTESLVEFVVESTIFRVHSFFLDRESEGSYRFYTPGVNRVYLGGTTCLEFASLMKFFYYGMLTSTTFTLSEWSAILSISTRYEMTVIRLRAISEVYSHRHNIDPVEWIVISEKNNVVEWLLEARTALCSREAPVTHEELRRLGYRNSSLVAEAREAILRARIASLPDNCRCAVSKKSVVTTRDLVDDVFGREGREKEILRQEQEREKERLEKEQEQERLKRETQHEQEQERLEQQAIRAMDELEAQKAEQANAEARAQAIKRERKEKQMYILERKMEAERKAAEMVRVGELEGPRRLDGPSPQKSQGRCEDKDLGATDSTCTVLSQATATAPPKRLSLKERIAQAEAVGRKKTAKPSSAAILQSQPADDASAANAAVPPATDLT